MSRNIVIMAVMALWGVASFGAVDVSAYKQWTKFETTAYKNNQVLSDTGATAGGWGVTPVPTGSDARVLNDDGTKRLIISAKGDNAIVFTANRRKWTSSAVYYQMNVTFGTRGGALSPLQQKAKTGFTVAKKSSGMSFYCYADEGWIALQDATGAVTAEFDREYDLMIVLECCHVSYYINTDAGYTLLTAEDGREEFPLAGSDRELSKLMFDGDGKLTGFVGGYRPSAGILKVRQ